jgi:hypothetical protein
MTHTPGPWHLGGWFSVHRGEKKNPDNKLDYTNIWSKADPGMSSGQRIAENVHASNARLIAAAPDLLEACKFVAGRLQAGDCEYDDVASMVLNLQSAIQKAENGQ